ncbi:MAG TPA: TetR/AcrR family transcriptional regulator [Acholeplasma sp.]|nr:TetR/AcrR family transcriptional regulator [Acholeplasma sp.]
MDSNIRLPKTKVGYKSFYKIIEVSKELFRVKGVSTTSVNEIIEKAEVATGTFYNYFDDKLAVYKYLLDDYSTIIRKRIYDAIRTVETRYEKERIGIKTFLEFAREDKLSYRIIWESLFIDQRLFVNYYTNFSNAYVNQLAYAVKGGQIKDNIDLKTLSFMLMGIANFVGLQVVFEGDLSDEELDKITDQIMYVLKNGMFT